VSIFNTDKTKLNSDKNISPEDYEKRIAERNEEYRRLNDILRGMRAEVSNLMDEIKRLSDEVVKKNAEVFLVDQKLDELNRNHQLLKQNIEDEQEIYLNLVKKIEKLKEELKSDLQIQDKLNQLKIEYNMISNQIAEKKSEFEIIQNLISTSFMDDNLKDETAVDKHKIKKYVKRCVAKTKNGIKCKRKALENSEYCAIHLKQFER
jgi:chromosome segregation ATPase